MKMKRTEEQKQTRNSHRSSRRNSRRRNSSSRNSKIRSSRNSSLERNPKRRRTRTSLRLWWCADPQAAHAQRTVRTLKTSSQRAAVA